MARTTDSNLIAQLQALYSRPVIYVRLDFESGVVYGCSGLGTLEWDGHTWSGLGTMVKIELPEENADKSSVGARFTLAAPSEIISLALGEVYHERSAKIWVACLDENLDPISDPILYFDGVMSQMEIDRQAKDGYVTLSVEKTSLDDAPEFDTFDDQNQQGKFPGDTFFAHLVNMPEKLVTWGDTTPAQSGGATTPPGSGSSIGGSNGGGGRGVTSGNSRGRYGRG